MIEDYFAEKQKKVEKEKLLAWKQFYQDCNNEWYAVKAQRQIDKL